MYQESLKFLLQFCCMNLIAATRAEGGLVFDCVPYLFELILVLSTFLDRWVGGFGGMETKTNLSQS